MTAAEREAILAAILILRRDLAAIDGLTASALERGCTEAADVHHTAAVHTQRHLDTLVAMVGRHLEVVS